MLHSWLDVILNMLSVHLSILKKITNGIKIPFINKGIEFIDLPSIFKDRSVTSSIPTYFQISEPPIICYEYNKPIRNTVFNFNKLVSDLDIHANTPESWDCKDSKFIYPAAGHIMTEIWKSFQIREFVT